jgi:putative salt-induced outer membrane protein YdiY
MVQPHFARLALAVGLVFAAAPAVAQSRDSLRLTGDVGIVNTAGNTDLTTINVGQEVRWRRGRMGLGQMFALVYGRSGGETTSSLWRAGVRGDYALSEAVAVYARVGYDRDRFAGIARRFEEGTGVALALLRRTRNRLEAEAGFSLVQQRSTLGIQDDFASSRGAATYEHRFTEETYFRQMAEATANLEDASDYRLTTESAFVAPLSSHLALKISYVVRYDHRPEPGFRSTDRLLTSGLQFTL